MKHDNAIKLLQRHGIEVKTFFDAHNWRADHGIHQLTWRVCGWRGMITDVLYFFGEAYMRCNNMLLHEPCERLANGTLVKRFIERVTQKDVTLDDVRFEFGPDATHKSLAPSVRLVRNQQTTRTFHPVAVAMGEAWKSGEDVLGVIKDWFEDHS